MTHPKIKRKRRTPFQVWFHAKCDEIFSCAFDPDICDFKSINHLAEKAGLAHQTVAKAYAHETLHPRLETVWKLCKAIGMDIELVKEEIEARPRLRIAQ